MSGRAFYRVVFADCSGGAFWLVALVFQQLFRENFGRTFAQHINSLRIEQAARLLRKSDLPVMEVGFHAGFDNFGYFVKRFCTVYGALSKNHPKRFGVISVNENGRLRMISEAAR
ncbi:helix-turn-helix domain-containing protein [Candidatus Agathobaculum pullicola]|uniref:helix-turn-helix domain-containing protein n=1 Tax=Candidatus Agathobaculum pullicola TaxID=2838426 RepID=UPI003F8DC0F6